MTYKLTGHDVLTILGGLHDAIISHRQSLELWEDVKDEYPDTYAYHADEIAELEAIKQKLSDAFDENYSF